jgi:bla regulator protein blaR1
MRNVAIWMLLGVFAYDTDRFRTAGPDWIARERFDISATGAVTGQIKSMLRQLLQDRFGLRAHFDTRRVPVYVLSVAHADGTLGPNLRRVEMDCAKRDLLPDGMTPCSTRNQPRGTLVARGTNWQTAILHREIATTMDRLVLDRTSLKGQFDMRLEWSDPVAQSTDAPAVDRPSLVTALREQLGLRLEPAIEAVPVLVIDRIERPSPD